MSFTMKALTAAVVGLHWSSTMVSSYEVMLRLCYGFVVAAAMGAASAKRRLLWLLCQPGENGHACRSFGSWSLFPAF